MANVELKTDFKDGEKLYGPELNNNFKAIKAALEAMNRIVWQDDQEIPDTVSAFRGTTEELMNREIIDGQLLYDTNTGETYIDYEGRRISTGSGNAIHIGESKPTNPSTQIWIPTDEFNSVGTEVVNSLEGNEERMAPSVAAVKKGLLDTYSTKERVIGIWEDEKPLYGIDVHFSFTGSESTSYPTLTLSDLGINNVDHIHVKESVNISLGRYAGSGGYRFEWYLDLESKQVVINNPELDGKLFLVLAYTKTTD